MRHLLSLAMLEMASLPLITMSYQKQTQAYPKGPRKRRAGPRARRHK